MHDLHYVPALMNGQPITSQANVLGLLDYHIFLGYGASACVFSLSECCSSVVWSSRNKSVVVLFTIYFKFPSKFSVCYWRDWHMISVLFLLLLTDYLHFSVNKIFLFVLVLCLKFYSSVVLLLELNWFLLERNWSLSKFRCEALFRSSCLSNHLYSCFFAESRISVCSDNESCW